jgi:hypothetical protein
MMAINELFSHYIFNKLFSIKYDKGRTKTSLASL